MRFRRKISSIRRSRRTAGSVADLTVLQTHLWAHTNPRRFKQEGKLIFLRQCSRCGRDLVGSDWCAVYLGAFKVERLAGAINDQWLKEQCPMMRLPADNAARGHVIFSRMTIATLPY
jgi:hypothetical protein